MKVVSIKLDGMKCHGCVSKIKGHFQSYSTINKININLEDKNVEISGNDDLSNMKIRNDLIDLGFIVNSIKKV